MANLLGFGIHLRDFGKGVMRMREHDDISLSISTRSDVADRFSSVVDSKFFVFPKLL